MDIKEILETAIIEDTSADQETIIKARRASAEGAFQRLEELKFTLLRLEKVVNDTNIDNTEKSWHIAYKSLTKAFQDCIKEEKQIIVRS